MVPVSALPSDWPVGWLLCLADFRGEIWNLSGDLIALCFLQRAKRGDIEQMQNERHHPQYVNFKLQRKTLLKLFFFFLWSYLIKVCLWCSHRLDYTWRAWGKKEEKKEKGKRGSLRVTKGREETWKTADESLSLMLWLVLVGENCSRAVLRLKLLYRSFKFLCQNPLS